METTQIVVQGRGHDIRQASAQRFQTMNLSANQQTDDDNTGARLWSCAQTLVEWLEREGIVKGKSVVELGCGTGAVSVACGVLGGRVVATDGNTGTVALALATGEATMPIPESVKVMFKGTLKPHMDFRDVVHATQAQMLQQ